MMCIYTYRAHAIRGEYLEEEFVYNPSCGRTPRRRAWERAITHFESAECIHLDWVQIGTMEENRS